MLRTRIIILIIIVITLFGGWISRGMLHGDGVDESALLKELAPDLIFLKKSGSPLHYLADDGSVAFNSFDIVADIRGYAGHIKTLILLDADGVIRDVSILSHRETKNYVHSMLERSYLDSFRGMTVNSSLEPGKDIDAITRATVSVDALTDTVRQASRTVATDVLGLEVVSRQMHGGTGSPGWLVMLALFAVALLLSRVRPGGRERDIVMVLSVVIVGLWLSSPITSLHLFNILLGRVSTDPLWIVVVTGTVVSVMLAGRLYCGWLCPLGAIIEFAGRLPFKKWVISIEQDKQYRKVKYLLFALMAILALLSGQTGYVGFEPYITLFSFNGTVIAWTIVLIAIFGGLWVSRFWCRYLCPAGAVLALASPSKSKYFSSPDCPMGNPPGKPVEKNASAGHVSECIVCGKCFKIEDHSSGQISENKV